MIPLHRQCECWKTSKAQNIIAKLKVSSNKSCKDEKDSEKIPDKDISLIERIFTLFLSGYYNNICTALSWQSCWTCTRTCMASVGKSEKELV